MGGFLSFELKSILGWIFCIGHYENDFVAILCWSYL